MNISPSSQENSKVPSSSSQASGEVTDRMQGTLLGSSNTKPIDNDTKKTHDGSLDVNVAKIIQKDITENPNKIPSPSTDDLKKLATAATTAELDANVENAREPLESPSHDAKFTAKEDISDETKEKLGIAINTTSSSNSSTGATCADDAAVDNAKPIKNADVKNADSNTDGATESKEKAKAVEAPKKRTRKKWKKPPGKPNRPLSAYNLYFRKERAVMLGDAADKTDQEQGKKRVHRKSHGKIGFAEMARIIGGKWKALPEEDKKEFVEVAVVEKERYAKDLANWREEQKQKIIINSMGPGRKSKIGKGSDDEDDLVQSIAEDREKLLRQHQAFRMQMMQEMQVGHLGRLPSEGHGRQMPTIDYLRNMQDDRTGPYFGRNRTGTPSSLYSHYPSAAEGSGRDLYQQMVAMTSGPDGQGREPDQLRQLKMARMQMMNGSMADGPAGSSMGTMGGSMGNAMSNAMGNPIGTSMGAPMGNPMCNSMGNNGMGNTMGNPMGNPMSNNGMGNTMGNTMGMIPINNGSHMSNSAPHSQYEMERFQHMRYQNQMVGMNNNQMPIATNSPTLTNCPRGGSDMTSHERSSNMGSAVRRFPQQNRYN